MPTGEDAHGSDYFTPVFLLPQLCNSTVDSLSTSGEIDEEWQAFITARKESELATIINDENLKPEESKAFVETAFRDGGIQSSGTAITRIMPPIPRFAPSGGHGEKKSRVLNKLGEFFERFFELSS